MYIPDGSHIDYLNEMPRKNLFAWGWIGNKVLLSIYNLSEKDYQLLLKTMRYNATQMAWTQMPCTCKPPCTATQQQIEALNQRLQEDLKKAG